MTVAQLPGLGSSPSHPRSSFILIFILPIKAYSSFIYLMILFPGATEMPLVPRDSSTTNRFTQYIIQHLAGMTASRRHQFVAVDELWPLEIWEWVNNRTRIGGIVCSIMKLIDGFRFIEVVCLRSFHWELLISTRCPYYLPKILRDLL